MLHRIALAVSLVAALAFAGVAAASNGAGPTKTTASSISAPVILTPTASTATAVARPGVHFGDTVPFDVSTAETTSPFVNLTCFQNRDLVAQGWAAFFEGGLGGRSFTLVSPMWTGGAADCTANLDVYVNYRWKVLASTSFHVDA